MFGIPLSIGLLLVAFIHTAVTITHLVMGGVGHKVILPCVSPFFGSCSNIRWYHSTQTRTTVVARIPRIEEANTGRLKIWSNCFLHIHNITALDVGIYWCSKSEFDVHHLSLITVSSSPGSNLLPGASVTLSCRLVTFEGPGRCFTSLYQGMSLKWQDDIQPDYMLAEQRSSKCAVTLTVIIQRGSRFSCLALVNDLVQSTVEFPIRIPVVGRSLPIPDSENNDQDGDGGNSQVIIAVAVVGCCAMTVVLALIAVKKRKPNDQPVAHPESPLYVNTVINTDVAATAEDVTYSDIMVAGLANRKWETKSEATVYATVHPSGRKNVRLA